MRTTDELHYGPEEADADDLAGIIDDHRSGHHRPEAHGGCPLCATAEQADAERNQAAADADEARQQVCATCGKDIVTTEDAGVRPLSRQSSWQHADGTGAGVGGARAQWCDNGTGYGKVQPAPEQAPSMGCDEFDHPTPTDSEPGFSHDGEGAFYGGSRRPSPLEATDRCPQCGTDFRGKYCEACALVDTAVDLVHELIGDDDASSDRLDALASLLATVSAKPELTERIALESGMLAP